MRMLALARRNILELLCDPLTLGFAILRAERLAVLGMARELTALSGAENFEEAFLRLAGEGGAGI